MEIITHIIWLGNSLFSVVLEIFGIVDTVDNVDEFKIKLCKIM